MPSRRRLEIVKAKKAMVTHQGQSACRPGSPSVRRAVRRAVRQGPWQRSVMWRFLMVRTRGPIALRRGQGIAQALDFACHDGDLFLLGGHQAVQMIEQILRQAEFFLKPGQTGIGLVIHRAGCLRRGAPQPCRVNRARPCLLSALQPAPGSSHQRSVVSVIDSRLPVIGTGPSPGWLRSCRKTISM